MSYKNYNKFSKEHNDEEVIKEDYNKIGKISGAPEVYVRQGPGKDYEPVTTVKKDEEVQIIDEHVNDGWYKICLSSGIEAYIMKDFITI